MSIPSSIGRYKILEVLGRGAMGVVYLAHDPRIDRRVAIKTVGTPGALPAREADEMRRRFLREARAAGRLQHPGIVTIFDVGEHEGSAFIAMEYIEGETLDRHIGPGKLLPIPRSLSLVRQACEALDYAHRQDIVHRDIKPANLILVGGEKVKITDFGLAKNPSTSLTQEGVLLGTPNYMSPEQVTGRPLDGRSDIFSLGAVLYEMLAGTPPFAGDSITTIIYRIVNEPPRDIRAYANRIPASVGQVVMRALEKLPQRRFQTCAEMALALEGRAAMTAVMEAGGPGQGRARPPVSAPAGGPPIPSAGPGRNAPQADAPSRPSSAAARAPRRVESIATTGVWYGRARGAFMAAGVLGAILLVPATGTRDDRWGRGEAGEEPPFYRTAAILGGMAPPSGAGQDRPAVVQAAQIALPGVEEAVKVTVRTDPPGGRVYLDDVEAPAGILLLSRDDRGKHTVVAENDCFIEQVEYRLQDPAGEDTLTIPLKTHKIARVPVTSEPAGARILLDGEETGLVTPADLTLTRCDPHRVALKLKGYKDVAQKLEDLTLPLKVALEQIPEGWVTIESDYPVDVFEDGRRIGTSGEPIKMLAGKHEVTLRNKDLFVERNLGIEIMGDKRVSRRADLPGLGALTVLASPSNCRIFVNGTDIGVPPINDYELAAGTYTVRAVYVPTGEAKESAAVIAAGGKARVPFKFNP